jgi:membrane-associated protease RseP (regulator of RpoE activity)
MAEIAKESQRISDAGGNPHQGYIGVLCDDLTDAQLSQMHLAGGVSIEQVAKDGPAASADMKEGDTITRIGNAPIANRFDFIRALFKSPPGTPVAIEFSREGKQQTTTLTLVDHLEDAIGTDMFRPGDLQYASGQAEYRVGQAEYSIGAAEYQLQSVQRTLDQAKDNLQATENDLISATELATRVQREQGVIAAHPGYIEKLSNGALWTAVVTTAGIITDCPTDKATPLCRYQMHQALSVLPMGSDWCMVILQNKTIGWIARANLAVKGG